MAELNQQPGRQPSEGPRSLRLLPRIAVVSAIIGLFDHPIGTVGAVLATAAVVGATLLRLAVAARSWTDAADRRYLLATAALLVVIMGGVVLGSRG